MGEKRQGHGRARLEARLRFLSLRLAGLQRSGAPLRAWARLSQSPAADDELRGVDEDLSVGTHLWFRRAVRGTALHPSVFTRLDRFSEDPRSLHEGEGQ